MSTRAQAARPAAEREAGHPGWYKDAVIYELHVRAFADSDGDGIGDFRGLTARLEYLQDLGVTAVWLLPFYPSPLRDDGYDISSYTDVHPAYGAMRDFRMFLRQAHRLGIRVITELVLNHTSDQHPWFQRARRAPPGSPEREWYVWSDTTERYREARVIFQDFESSNWAWDPVAGAYYWHRFYSHQPDLNYDNPAVRGAMLEVVEFWLEAGVDGLRLDAVPYLFERSGTNCENLPETHAFLGELRSAVDARFGDRMLLAEANQWPEDAVAYLGGEGCHMAFHFPLMPRMFMAVRMEDRFPIIDILAQTPPIPDVCQWALFLRNHDELTLEMVTDEERDYMYRAYAEDPQARINLGIRRRLGPLLGNDRRLIEMSNGLLFALPGTPVIYYGDEIGMGDNIYLGDRNGVRTPMQWSADRNAGFSSANPQRLYLPVIIDPEYHAAAINVEAQQNAPSSLLWWMKRLIALRKRFRALGRGSLEFLYPDNRKVLVFLRSYEDERILVVVNLARTAQYVELDLSRFRGMVPVELFGNVEFPPIGELPYFLTLGPHGFYWFALQPEPAGPPPPGARVPTLDVAGPWTSVLARKNLPALADVLPGHLRGRRWFGGKGRRIRGAEVVDAIPVPRPDGERRTRTAGYLAIVRVEYVEGEPESYLLPLAAATGLQAEELREWRPQAIVARLRTRDGEAVLYDALYDPDFCRALLAAVRRRRQLPGTAGKLAAWPTATFRRITGAGRDGLDPSVVQAEQSNTSVVYGDRLILKLFRRIEEGVNPDQEITRFLTERAAFPHVPPLAGALEYRRGRQPASLGVVHGFVANEGDAWQYTVDSVGRYLEEVQARDSAEPPLPAASLLALADRETPSLAHDTIGAYLESARLLGRRTAELHLALASDRDAAGFRPEPITPLDQRSMYQSMRVLARRVFQLLEDRREDVREANQVLDLEDQVLERFRALLDVRIRAARIRCHGDFHLGQVLYTGNDFVIIDFEGEPARPLSERRIKRPPLRDVAGLIRSFHYAASSPLQGGAGPPVPGGDVVTLHPWTRFWYLWVSAEYLRTYLEVAAGAPFLPKERRQLEVLLDVFLLEKALYEVGYEVNNRPEWVGLPIQALVQLVEVGA
ncbi:MAG TPA: maltose alpha-D-glucosyltransferase [Actinomycetota bacterium]|nr:maltose alpha-D-glucosyltransferase [Actinomycetota bacterium]